MSFDFTNDIPIYLQIIEYIKTKIVSKEFLPNQKLPSVREFAMFFEVNPNTIQKALAELEEIGLIFTESTNGKFVTKDQSMINSLQDESINKIIETFYENMKQLGFNKDEAINFLQKRED